MVQKWWRCSSTSLLLNYDINAALSELGLGDIRMVHITKEHIEQQKQSMSGVKEWAVNWVELGEWPYGEVRDGHCYVIKSLLCHDYNNSPLGKRQPLSERQFGIQFLALFPLVVDGIRQIAEKAIEFKSAIRVSAPGASVQERNSRGKQADAYDIPPIAELRKVMDFNFGGESDWDEKEEWIIRYADNKVDIETKDLFVGP